MIPDWKHLPRIGMRNIKTALAVFFCLVICEMIDVIKPFYAGIAAVMSMKEDHYGSWKYGKERMFGTLIGGILGIFILTLEDALFHGKGNLFFLPIGIVISIYICNLFVKKGSVSISCVVLLAVALNHNGGTEKFVYAITRMIETWIGVVCATLVNKTIYPVKKEEKK